VLDIYIDNGKEILMNNFHLENNFIYGWHDLENNSRWTNGFGYLNLSVNLGINLNKNVLVIIKIANYMI
ncbi:hypothetical protein, partial [Neokomagataea thailandica]|uniref:hypothetical protein n=1 Tax=Neokomagataea thailandica TaxID=661190 RepID=UPI001C3FCB4B